MSEQEYLRGDKVLFYYTRPSLQEKRGSRYKHAKSLPCGATPERDEDVELYIKKLNQVAKRFDEFASGRIPWRPERKSRKKNILYETRAVETLSAPRDDRLSGRLPRPRPPSVRRAKTVIDDDAWERELQRPGVAAMKTLLYCEDCVPGIPLRVEPGSVDLVVTSPPYNLKVEYGAYQDDLSLEDYLAWTAKWTCAVRDALCAGGSLFLNFGAPPSRPLLPHMVICAIVEHGIFVLQNTFHWVKSIAIPDDANGGEPVQRGHYKPITSRRFVHDCHEYIFHLTKRGDVALDRLAVGVAYTHKSNIARWNHTAGRDRHCRGNTWFVPYRTIQSRATDRPHPASFPIELVANCLKIHGKKGAIVMDPFMGIGASAVAAAQYGANTFIGFEIDQEYLNIATQTLCQMGKLSDSII